LRAGLRLAAAEGRHGGGFDRRLHGLQIARFIEDEAGHRRIGKRRNQIAATDLDRIEAESRRRLVHQPFDGKRDHRTRDAAVRRHRTCIGQDSAGDTGILAHVVRAGQLRNRHQRLDGAGRGIAGIGADIGDDIRGKGDHLSVGVERAFERDQLIAAVEGGDEILAAVLHPCHRRLELAREPSHQHELDRQRHFLPEAAAHVGRDYPQIRFRHSDQIGNDRAHDVRHLGRTGERHALGRSVPCRMRRARL
jgi:hypothetical protein